MMNHHYNNTVSCSRLINTNSFFEYNNIVSYKIQKSFVFAYLKVYIMPFTIWVTYNHGQAVSLEFQTGTVDKLKDLIKRRVTSLGKVYNGDIILRKHGAIVDLEPDETVDDSFANTAREPIQVSTTGKRQHERDV